MLIDSQPPSTRKPVVAHAIRTYLCPTESFIYNQIRTVEQFNPIVLCHRKKNNHPYQINEVYCIQDLLTGPNKLLDHITYEYLRKTPPIGIHHLQKILIEQKAQLLHFHYLVDARFFLRLKEESNLPAIVSAYGYDLSSFPKRLWGIGLHYLRPIFDKVDRFLAMSQDMQKDMVKMGIPSEKIIIHYYGTDTKRFQYPERTYLEKDELNILVCGSLERKKAQNKVLEALRLVEKKSRTRKKFRVTFVGDGPLRNELKKQVADYGWEKRVLFTGHIPHTLPDLVEVYRQADIFSLPSITVWPRGDKEGIPGTIIEAMASGLPVLSTYHAGIPEVIESGQNGLLVNEGDIEAMSIGFAELINDHKLRKQLGSEAANKACKKYDLSERTKNLESIYHQLLNGQ